MCFSVSLMSVSEFICLFGFFFFKQKTAYEMRISDWSSDVCSSDLAGPRRHHDYAVGQKDSLLDGMRYEDDCLAFAVPDSQQLRLQQVAGLNVECAVGFIHQQRVRLNRQGPRDADTLLHAAAELVWIRMFEARQADQVDVVARPLPSFRSEERSVGKRGGS